MGLPVFIEFSFKPPGWSKTRANDSCSCIRYSGNVSMAKSKGDVIAASPFNCEDIGDESGSRRLILIVVVKKTFRYPNVFSTTTYAPILYTGTFLWKRV